jgi:hypothetical protein
MSCSQAHQSNPLSLLILELFDFGPTRIQGYLHPLLTALKLVL